MTTIGNVAEARIVMNFSETRAALSGGGLVAPLRCMKLLEIGEAVQPAKKLRKILPAISAMRPRLQLMDGAVADDSMGADADEEAANASCSNAEDDGPDDSEPDCAEPPPPPHRAAPRAEDGGSRRCQREGWCEARSCAGAPS